jgi:type II secretory pathway component PulF
MIMLLPTLLSFLFFFLVPAGVLAAVLHGLISLPLRRRERARFFLDLIESSLDQGRSVEQTIVSAAESRDRAMGVRFHLLAAHIEGGLSLGAALEKVPRFLPPQISSMLRVGEKLGDLRRALPACRELLQDRPLAVQGAVHYMLILLLVFSPVAIFVMVFVMTRVFPRMYALSAEMNGTPPWTMRFISSHAGWLVGFQALVFLALMIAAAVYVGGPRFVRRLQFRGLPFVDWIAWRVPWKRKRLQRTFSAMLAVLLDGGAPEPEAVRLAGDCTANEICRHRAGRIIVALQQGTGLGDAVHAFDDSGEFHWRLVNATHARGGFLSALQGWHEALDAKAFQQEEATAHAITSALVILNGVLVALIATAMFGMLVSIMEAASL